MIVSEIIDPRNWVLPDMVDHSIVVKLDYDMINHVLIILAHIHEPSITTNCEDGSMTVKHSVFGYFDCSEWDVHWTVKPVFK